MGVGAREYGKLFKKKFHFILQYLKINTEIKKFMLIFKNISSYSLSVKDAYQHAKNTYSCFETLLIYTKYFFSANSQFFNYSALLFNFFLHKAYMIMSFTFHLPAIIIAHGNKWCFHNCSK